MLYHISTTRTLVFTESEANSNKYQQVYLDNEQYKVVTDAIGKKNGEKDDYGDDIYELRLSEEIFELPDLKDFY